MSPHSSSLEITLQKSSCWKFHLYVHIVSNIPALIPGAIADRPFWFNSVSIILCRPWHVRARARLPSRHKRIAYSTELEFLIVYCCSLSKELLCDSEEKIFNSLPCIPSYVLHD